MPTNQPQSIAAADVTQLAYGRIAFNLLDAMVAYWDKDKICRYANSAYLAWFGRTPEQMIGMHIRDLLGPLYEKNLPYMERALAGEIQVFERAIPRPDGTTRHSLATYIPHIADGTVHGFVAHVADVTQMKEYERLIESQRRGLALVNNQLQEEISAHIAARAELAASTRLVNAIYDHAPTAMVTYDSTGQCTSANAAASKLTGATVAELLSQNYHQIESWKVSGIYALAQQAVETGVPAMRDIFMRSTFGREFWVRAAFSEFMSGSEKRLLLMAEDITDRKRIEMERERLIKELRAALDNIKTLEGILPICASCKKIRDTGGCWSSVESYVSSRSKAEFSHGICPDCVKRLYPQYADRLPKV